MSRIGPYCLFLLAAVALLLAARPELLSGVDPLMEAHLLAVARLDALIRALLLSGSALMIIGLIWLVRVHGAEARRREYGTVLAVLAERVGGQIGASRTGFQCWTNDGPGGRFQVDLALEPQPAMRLLVGVPASRLLLVQRREGAGSALGWDPVAQGLTWELRAAATDRARRIGRDDDMADALDALFDSSAATVVRHGGNGVEVELSLVPPDEIVPLVERAYAVATCLVRLNS